MQLFGLVFGIAWTVPVGLMALAVFAWFGYVPNLIWVLLIVSYYVVGIVASRWYAKRIGAL